MAGVTKHIFEHEIRDIIDMWSKQIKTLQPVLPQEYTEKDIIELLKQYYPHEWKAVEDKYSYYKTKDKYIKKNFGKNRYNMDKPEELLKKSSTFKRIMAFDYKKTWSSNYSQEAQDAAVSALCAKRKPKIERINLKIEKALKKTQQVTPAFIDQLIGLYERKNTTQQDKVYILLELKKYYSHKIMQFFFKLNDTEINQQLRWEAFYHLQSFNYQMRVRRQKYMQVHTKNKKRKNFLKNVYAKTNI